MYLSLNFLAEQNLAVGSRLPLALLPSACASSDRGTCPKMSAVLRSARRRGSRSARTGPTASRDAVLLLVTVALFVFCAAAVLS